MVADVSVVVRYRKAVTYGVHALLAALETAGWDLAAIGEGESTIVSLVRALREDAPLTTVPGLAIKDADGGRCAPDRRRSCRSTPSPPSSAGTGRSRSPAAAATPARSCADYPDSL
jgi:hypothetical protein